MIMKTITSHVWIPMFLLLTTSIPVSADMDIAARLEDLKPLKAGDPAPEFTVYRVDGSAFRFEPDKLERPMLIIFYRGGWCGNCNQQLRDLATVMGDFREMNVNVIFANGDRPEILYSSLRPETTAAIKGLDYTLLSDSDLIAARAFGVAYVLDDETLERYKAREEWDLYQSSIDRHDALPLPSIYIIDTKGMIAFEYYNFDHTIRLPSEDLKTAVKKVVMGK
jgi:peroxiredoxin